MNFWIFQVQVFNENVTQPSEFSEGFVAKTDASQNGKKFYFYIKYLKKK